MSQYAKYYKTLGVPVGSSKQDIKRAFRRKAMLTHPDKNPNPNAKAQFLAINTAYEILTGQRALPQQERRKQTKPTPNSQESTSFSERGKEREERREKMRDAKRRKEEAYRNSPQFKLDLAIETVLDQMGYFIALLIMLPIPLFLFTDIYIGLIMATLFAALSSPFWYKALFTKQKTINVKHFIIAFKYIYTNTNFRYYLFGFINLIALLLFTFNTFIPLSLVFLVMLIPPGILYFKKRKQGKSYKNMNWFKATSIGPLLINLFFVLNYTFSHSPTDEYYRVDVNYETSTSFFMEFSEEVYSEYPGIRFFMINHDDSAPYAWLQIEKGLFGIKVLKSYDFIRYPGEKTSHD